MINWTLISNPWNWAVIITMVLIGGFIVDTLSEFYSSKTA